MTTIIEYTTTIELIRCGECGVPFGLDSDFVKERRKTHATFYCPNGHPRWYPGETDEAKAKRLERQLANAQEEARIERAAATKAKRELKAAQNKVKRVERAVCLVDGCQRSFVQMERHLRSQHPEFIHARDGH